MKSFRPSITRICWAITLVICIGYYLRIGKEAYNFYGDALGYYMYLPSTFIYHNHTSIEKLPEDRGIRPFIHSYAAQIGSGQRTPKGYVLNQYTYGIALMEAPFFFLAHGFEKLRGSQANGFSESYRWAIGLSTMVYGILGLGITYKVLRRRVPKEVASITVALLLLGTNLFWFVFHQQGMAHVPLFFLIACILYLTDLLYETGRWRYFIGLGFVAGLITIIRPIDGLCLLIPLLYHTGKPFVRTKFNFIIKHWLKILVAGLCFLIPVIPQLLYWKWLTGYIVYDSYGPNQGFDFLHPHVLSGLFGVSNGWLFYTPLMVFAILGLLFYRRLQPFAMGIYLLLPLYVWCVYSWFLPTYINGLGSRPMVDIYAVLALPFAVFLHWVWTRGKGVRIAYSVLLIGFVAINLSYSLQQAMGIIVSQDSKYRFNLQTLFRFSLDRDDLIVWDTGVPQPDSKDLKVVDAYALSLADTAFADHLVADTITHRNTVYLMREGEEYSPFSIKVPFDQLKDKSPAWIRCSGKFMTPLPEYDIYQNHLLITQIKRG